MNAVCMFAPLAAFCYSASADNAALTMGGVPKMLSAHKSVTMESEVVLMTIHFDRVEADCTFKFVNTGAACNVRMGFPDFASWSKHGSVFSKFSSYVDGKPVKCKHLVGEVPDEEWEVKTVSFAAHGRRIVREVYTTAISGLGMDPPLLMGWYVLHTGASWKGPIGKATIIVEFAPDCEVTSPPKVLYNRDPDHADPGQWQAWIKTPGNVIVSGVCRPIVSGHTLTFISTALKPTVKDDIMVGFGMSEQRYREMQKKWGGKGNPSLR